MAKGEIQHVPGAKFALIKASFDLEANKSNYQAILQELASVQVTRENVGDGLSKPGRAILKMLEDKKDLESKEPLQTHRDIMSVYKDLRTPIEEHVFRIEKQVKEISLQIENERNQQVAEQTRINSAKAAIIEFTNKIAGLISSAKSDDEIVLVEKMIGSEKTKTTVYQEFLPDLVTKCDALRPQIRNQKENIRLLKSLEKKEKAALDSGDMVTAAQIKGEIEYTQEVINETGLRINESAFEQAILVDIVAAEVVDEAPKGRSNWKWEVEDIKILQKKMPHLVKLVPDEEAIDLLLKTKKQDGSLSGALEHKWNGIRFFNDKSYK